MPAIFHTLDTQEKSCQTWKPFRVALTKRDEDITLGALLKMGTKFSKNEFEPFATNSITIECANLQYIVAFRVNGKWRVSLATTNFFAAKNEIDVLRKSHQAVCARQTHPPTRFSIRA